MDTCENFPPYALVSYHSFHQPYRTSFDETQFVKKRFFRLAVRILVFLFSSRMYGVYCIAKSTISAEDFPESSWTLLASHQ